MGTRPSMFSTFSWPWRSARGEFCTVISLAVNRMDSQRLREILADAHPTESSFKIRDCIFSHQLDLALEDFGVRVPKTPVQSFRC